MNTSVSFPLAKLLKEKGFDDECKSYYDINEELNSHIGHIGDVWKNSEIENGLPYHKEKYRTLCISAPTIDEVKWWLYEKHGIWIDVYYNSKYKSWDYEYTNINWSQEEVDKKLEEDIHNLLDNIFNAKIKYNSPTEAYEAAIKYCLEKII